MIEAGGRLAAGALCGGGAVRRGRSQDGQFAEADVARVTHRAPLLVDACRVFTCMISAAVAGRTREQVLAVASDMKGMPLKEEVLQLARGWSSPPDAVHRPPPGILRVLDRVAREFARGEDFAAGLARLAASRASDRDAACADYGALAGASVGEEGIAAELAGHVARRAGLQQLAERLFRRKPGPTPAA
jgi:ADP-ribosylglycohydrolase